MESSSRHDRDTTAEPAPEHAGDDLSALSWVQDELRRSLEAAHKALRRFLRDADARSDADVDAVDPAILRGARAQLHASVGALELVGQAAAALVLRASETALQRFVARPEKLTAKVVDDIERASFGVLDYVARLLAGKSVAPLALFPHYRAVQEAAGAQRVHPADLWSVAWRWRELPGDPSATPRPADAAALAALEAELLPLMRGSVPVAEAARMSDLCAGLGAAADLDAAGAAAPASDRTSGAGPAAAATLWKLAAAVFEAQAQGLLGFDVFSKRVASRLLSQFRSLARGEAEVSERLAQDLLFFCAQSASPGDGRHAPRLAAVRLAYGLAHHVPSDYSASALGRFDPALIAQAKKRVAAAKEAWSAVAGGEVHRLGGLAEQFSLVGDTLRRLFPLGEEFAAELQQCVGLTQQSGAAPPAPLAMEVATSLLYIEAVLDDADFDHPKQAERVQRLAERLAAVRGGQPPQPLEAWMEELYRRVSDHQTMGSVVHELRTALGEAEKLIDRFFRQPDAPEVLIAVPQQLASMRGVLTVLGMDHAAAALLRMRDDVDGLASTEVELEHVRDAGVFDRLAGNLGALGFLIDMLAVQPQLAKSLFTYDAESGALRPVMGRGDVALPVGAPDAPAAPVEPRLIEQAQMLAFASVRSDVPVEDVTRDLDWLAGEAAAAAQPALAATVQRAQSAFEHSSSPAELAEARSALSEALVDFVATATGPEGFEPAAAPDSGAAPAEAPAVGERVEPRVHLDFGPVGLEDDAEMREVFLDEAREVLGNARTALAALDGEPGDLTLLTTVRRAFHTLKGSARMVGLKDFGEAAWISSRSTTRSSRARGPPSRALLDFTGWCLDHLASWVDAIAAARQARTARPRFGPRPTR